MSDVAGAVITLLAGACVLFGLLRFRFRRRAEIRPLGTCATCRYFSDFSQPDDLLDEPNGYCCHPDHSDPLKSEHWEYGGHWTHTTSTCKWWGALTAFVLLLGSLSASAQAPAVGPVTAATKIAWDLQNVPSAAIAQSYEARTSLDGVRSTPSVLMANVSCAASVPPQANQVTCQATLPQGLVDALKIAGKHALVLRIYDPSTKLESPDSMPFVLLAAPASPLSIRIGVAQ